MGMHNGHLITREFKNKDLITGSLAIYDQEYSLLKEFKLPFLPHSNFQNKWNLNLLVATPQSGNQAAIINLKNDEVKIISLNNEMQFTGHGFFITDSSNFVLTAMNKKNQKGEIIYFNQSGTILRQQSSYGFSPHQVEIDFLHPTMAIVTNSGKAPLFEESTLTWFNINDGLFIKKNITQKVGESLKHFTQTKDNKIYVYGNALKLNIKSPLLYFYQPNQENELSKWKKLGHDWDLSGQGEILNLLLDLKNERLWMTLPDKGLVLIINPTTNLLEKKFERKKATLLFPLIKSDKIYVTCDPIENRRFFSRNKKKELSLESKYFKPDNLGPHIAPFKRPAFSL